MARSTFPSQNAAKARSILQHLLRRTASFAVAGARCTWCQCQRQGATGTSAALCLARKIFAVFGPRSCSPSRPRGFGWVVSASRRSEKSTRAKPRIRVGFWDSVESSKDDTHKPRSVDSKPQCFCSQVYRSGMSHVVPEKSWIFKPVKAFLLPKK